MRKILVAVALMAFSTTAFAQDAKKEDPNVKHVLVLVSTNTKTGESKATVMHHADEGHKHKAVHDDHAATLLNWGKIGGALKKGAKATAKGAKKAGQLAYKHRGSIAGAAKTGVGLASAGVGIAGALGANIDPNHPALIGLNITNSILNAEEE